MSTLAIPVPISEAVYPSEADVASAKEAKRLIAERRQATGQVDLSGIILPDTAADLLLNILDEMSHGNAVTLDSELTAQEVADQLDIPLSNLDQLLDEGKILSRTVGVHHHISRNSFLSYEKVLKAERFAIVAEMIAHDREIGLHY